MTARGFTHPNKATVEAWARRWGQPVTAVVPLGSAWTCARPHDGLSLADILLRLEGRCTLLLPVGEITPRQLFNLLSVNDPEALTMPIKFSQDRISWWFADRQAIGGWGIRWLDQDSPSGPLQVHH